MTVILDASVALKLVIEEEGSDLARILVSKEELAAPDLLFVECANVLWVQARRSLITKEAAMRALAAIEAAPIRAIPLRTQVRTAQAIAFEINQSVYDGLYLATAVAENTTLVTDDRPLLRAASAHPLYGAYIRPLIA